VGLGKGVSLVGASWSDQKSHQLRLSSGENWSVSGAGEVSNRRLKDCVFKHNGTANKTAYWKSGLTEVLGKVGGGSVCDQADDFSAGQAGAL